METFSENSSEDGEGWERREQTKKFVGFPRDNFTIHVRVVGDKFWESTEIRLILGIKSGVGPPGTTGVRRYSHRGR